ncbi:MAG: hypothetical protein IPG45_18185 [Deltaproteobacteria bacterium]|nr:hypothetical protein [Deltaproteobacteria bacterium]
MPYRYEKGKVSRKADQIHEMLLCRRCEDRFRGPEGYVKRWAYTPSEPSPLLKLPKVTTISETTFAVSGEQLDTEKFAIFAASIVWRTTVAKHTGVRIELGPYQEVLRKFLVGETSFPDNALLMVSVIFDEEQAPHGLVGLPQRFRDLDTGMVGHMFTIAGLVFYLWLGKEAGRERHLCFTRQSLKDRFVLVMPAGQIGLFRGVRDLLKGSPRPKS